MKKGFLLAMSFACLSFGLFAGEPETPVVTEEVQTVTLTVAELKASYGENIEFDGVLAEDATVTIEKMLTPCDDLSLLPCGAELAIAKQQLQQEANACCCILIYGVECCDPATGSLYAVLFLVEPRDPACN